MTDGFNHTSFVLTALVFAPQETHAKSFERPRGPLRREEAEDEKRLQREKRKRKADLIETMQIIGIAGGGVLAVFLICFTLLTIWVR